MSLSSLGDLGCLALDAFSDYVIRSALQVRCEGVCVDLRGWSRVHQLSNLSLPGRSLSQLKPLFPLCGGLNRKCPPPHRLKSKALVSGAAWGGLGGEAMCHCSQALRV